MLMAWYFAYGSNMQTATLNGRRGIATRRALAARAPGWRLVLDKPPLVAIGESYANIVPDVQAEVLGVLYEIAGDDLAHLDLTEGVLIGNYQRVEIAVSPLARSNGDSVNAFTLVSDRRDATLQPSTRYMDLLIAGAEEHGLPADYVAFLRAIPARPPSQEAEQFRALLDGFLRRPS